MELQHYAAKPLLFDRARTYTQGEPRANLKPSGLWVSVVGDDDWPAWCQRNSYGLDELAVAHHVNLSATADLLTLRRRSDLDAFAAENLADSSTGEDSGIDWRAVARRWDGILIAPYQGSLRRKHGWYTYWDCASGCVWNLDAIASVEALENQP